MKRLNKILLLIMLMSMISAGMVFWYMKYQEKTTENREIRALFSWTSEAVDDKEVLFETMKKANLNTIFQSFMTDRENNGAFLKSAYEKEIKVYALTGDPRWAMDSTGSSMMERVARISEINRNIAEEYRISGIVLDVEPYLLDTFLGQQQEVMESFVQGLQRTYQEAKKQNLEFGVCIPYYYDSWNLNQELEKIIMSSDFILVMNYYREKEIEHMAFEMELAERHQKQLITIYELQEPGKYGLTDKNTYFNEGLDKVEKNFLKIREYFGNQNVSVAYHEYESLKELLEDE